MDDRPVERAAGKGCVRHEFIYTQPHLGNDQWGPIEFVDLVYTGGQGSYRLYGEYAPCPAASSPDETLVKLWRAWRGVRMADRVMYWSYNESVASPDVAPIALIARETRSVSNAGALYRVLVYDAFFSGCDYWPTSDDDYKCMK